MEDILKSLLNKGADINSKNNEGDTALHIAASQSNFKRIFKKISRFYKETFFSDQAEICEILNDRGAQMEVRNKAGLTPLLRAFDWGNL